MHQTTSSKKHVNFDAEEVQKISENAPKMKPKVEEQPSQHLCRKRYRTITDNLKKKNATPLSGAEEACEL